MQKKTNGIDFHQCSLDKKRLQECHNDSLKSYHRARKKKRTSHEMKRYNRGVSPQGNGNCEQEAKQE